MRQERIDIAFVVAEKKDYINDNLSAYKFCLESLQLTRRSFYIITMLSLAISCKIAQ